MNILEILQQRNVPIRQHGDHKNVRYGWVAVECPFCGRGSDAFHMGFHLTKRFSSCWQCGYHPAWKTLAELLGIRYVEARELLGSDPGWEQDDRRKIRRGELLLPPGLGELLPPHERYLKERGFDPDELVRLWDIQGIGIASKLAWRIFIPVLYHGSVVSWTTRSLVNKGVRYVSASQGEEAISAKSLLFGEDYARHAIIICEGPFDVFRIGPGAVATLGLSISHAQIEKMRQYPVRAVCFDNEYMAQKRAKKLCRLLEPFPGTTHNVVLKAKDPGSASREEIDELRKEFLE